MEMIFLQYESILFAPLLEKKQTKAADVKSK